MGDEVYNLILLFECARTKGGERSHPPSLFGAGSCRTVTTVKVFGFLLEKVNSNVSEQSLDIITKSAVRSHALRLCNTVFTLIQILKDP